MVMKKETQIKILDKVFHSALGAFSNSLKDGDGFLPLDAFVKEDKDFYKGTVPFLKKPKRGAKWCVGSAQASLVPEDILKRPYYLGGYISPDNGFKNLIKYVIDNMAARCIAIDDGSKRGISVFCTVDCIGITNADIRNIRKAFSELFSKEYPDKTLASVNVFSTHTHSCIDTEGLWTDLFGKIHRNIKRNRSGKGILEKGADEQYMRFLTKKASEAMLEAVRNMTPGEMYFAKKDLSSKYFSNKNRPSATGMVTEIMRLSFYPDDKNIKPLLIVNLPIHPDVAGLPTSDREESGHELSGDYIYYMGETVNKAGVDFMFFNGAICAIYSSRELTNDGIKLKARYEQSERFGREMGRIALALTKTVEEIEADSSLCTTREICEDAIRAQRDGGKYTLWYEGWKPVFEEKVEPFFNIRLKEVKVPVENPLIAAAGKLRLANYKVLKENKNRYCVFTEVGFLQFGNSFKAVLVPGEYCCDLLVGGASLKKESSARGYDFEYPTAREIFGDDTYALGLANDAVGYIVPDNDYTLGDPKNHYHEFVSLGCFTGSAVNGGLSELKKSLDAEEKANAN